MHRPNPNSTEGTHTATLRPDGVILIKLQGRATSQLLRAWQSDYLRLGPTPIWLFDLIDADGYAPDAVFEATRVFQALKASGLEVVIVATRSSAIRMAALAVRMATGIATGITILVVENMEDAEREVAVSLSRLNP